jgi:hypothetical protein
MTEHLESTSPGRPDLVVERLTSDLVRVSVQDSQGTRHTRLGSLYHEIGVCLFNSTQGNETWRTRYASQVKGENIPFLHCPDNLKILMDPLCTIRDPIRSLNQIGEIFLTMLDSKQSYFKSPGEAQSTRLGEVPLDSSRPEPFLPADGIECTSLNSDVIKVTLNSPLPETMSLVNLYKNICNRLQAMDHAKGNNSAVWRLRHCSQVQTENFPLIHSPVSLEVVLDPMAIFRSPLEELAVTGQLLMSKMESRAYYSKSADKVFKLSRRPT